jgi:hypothetical protein
MARRGLAQPDRTDDILKELLRTGGSIRVFSGSSSGAAACGVCGLGT